MANFKKIICIDFDGVLHSYSSGWTGFDKIIDPPVDGAIEWLLQLMENPKLRPVIYSSRSISKRGIAGMKKWFLKYFAEYAKEKNIDSPEIWAEEKVNQLKFPDKKPKAFLMIDDRAFCFKGIFPTEEEMINFKPWNK